MSTASNQTLAVCTRYTNSRATNAYTIQFFFVFFWFEQTSIKLLGAFSSCFRVAQDWRYFVKIISIPRQISPFIACAEFCVQTNSAIDRKRNCQSKALPLRAVLAASRRSTQNANATLHTFLNARRKRKTKAKRSGAVAAATKALLRSKQQCGPYEWMDGCVENLACRITTSEWITIPNKPSLVADTIQDNRARTKIHRVLFGSRFVFHMRLIVLIGGAVQFLLSVTAALRVCATPPPNTEFHTAVKKLRALNEKCRIDDK